MENLQGDIEEVLDVKKALLKNFHGIFRGLLGKNFTYIGAKTKALLRNVNEVKRLMWLLFNGDCVSFYSFLNDLRFSGSDEHFSIFTFCDDDTMQSIDKLYKIAKDRVFITSLRKQKYLESDGEIDNDLKVVTAGSKKWAPKTLDECYVNLKGRHM